MKQAILGKWHFMRIIRLALGILVIIQAFITKDWTLGVLGALFTAMPIFNIGCCGVGACATPAKTRNEIDKDISYEEVA